MEFYIYYYYPEISSEIRMVLENFEKEHNYHSKKILGEKGESQAFDFILPYP